MNEPTPLGTINHITYYLAHGEVVRYQDGHEHLTVCTELVVELFGRVNELERELQQARYGRELYREALQPV